MFTNTSQNADSCLWKFGDGEELWQYNMNEQISHTYSIIDSLHYLLNSIQRQLLL